jgi:uncharacterized membrane protein (DUF485 family)
MLHEPAAQSGHDPAMFYKARLGIWMFLSYCLFYVGFVAINLWKPLWMEVRIALGMNLATVYGMALIIVALIQAVIYNALCRSRERSMADPVQEGAVK